MNINRHNYETFFLLYVDNELSAADRKAVEQFVQDNMDLKPELQLLFNTTLPCEAVSFNAKDQLYKDEVGQYSIQENLLLHLDNELDPITAQRTEATIASDNSIQKEWKVLQQTKLDANEKIIFKNKQLLYRHEKGRIITIRFWRVAVAAAILFAALFTGISVLKKAGPAENATVKNIVKPETGKPSSTNNGSRSVNGSVDTLKISVPGNIASIKAKEQINISAVPVIKNNLTAYKKETISKDQLVKDEKNVLPKTSLENINKAKSNEIIASVVLDKNKETVIRNKLPAEIASVSIKDKITAPSAPIIDYNSVQAKPDDYAKSVVLDETVSDNRILYMNEENVTRSKIGGLFRRVKRVIERNTNIKTGNGLRIAGFEFAVK